MGVWKHNTVLTREFLSQAHVRAMLDTELSRTLEIDRSIIAKYRKRFGLCSTHALKVQQGKIIRTEAIPDWEIGLLVGILLGDGSLYHTEEGRTCFRVAHCDKQLPYVEILRKVLSNLCVADIYTWRDKRTENLYHKIVTVSHSDLTQLYQILYRDGRKTVTQQILNLLTVPGLVALFYDDGSRNGNEYRLHTCSFSLPEQKLIRGHLYRKFGIKTTPIRVTNGIKQYWSLAFAKSTMHILEKYLLDFYLPCFRYKIREAALRSSETIRKALWDKFPTMKT